MSCLTLNESCVLKAKVTHQFLPVVFIYHMPWQNSRLFPSLVIPNMNEKFQLGEYFKFSTYCVNQCNC
jgi:hypothetical protein